MKPSDKLNENCTYKCYPKFQLGIKSKRMQYHLTSNRIAVDMEGQSMTVLSPQPRPLPRNRLLLSDIQYMDSNWGNTMLRILIDEQSFINQ